MKLLPYLLVTSWLFAERPATTTAPVATGSELSAYIVTIGPGDASWEKFGHNMIWISDHATGSNYAYNWGVFEFDRMFIPNFIRGRLWYKAVREENALDVIDWYISAQDRSVWVQELNLSPAQKLKLRDFCEWHVKPENSYYKYDYFIDNCSTRVRDAIDRALDGQLERAAATMPSELTYRSETRRLTAADPILYPALHFVLGRPIDGKLNGWSEMYIPMRMRDRLREVTIERESGRRVPLVGREQPVHQTSRPPLPTKPPDYIAAFLVAGILIGGAQAWSAYLARHESRAARWAFLTVTIPWAFLAGFAGCFLIYGWTLTDHSWVRNNENLLQLTPVCFPLIVLVPMALGRRRRAASIAMVLAGVALASSLVGLILKVLPWFDQINAEIIALALPANAGLAWAMWTLWKLPPPAEDSTKEKVD
jgi:hypothetical protein